jgi:2,5-dihydroxypyridine 5,6-dioxygenase
MIEKLAIDYAASAQLVKLFLKHLELCKVHVGEHVLIHSDPGTSPHYAAAYMGAAMLLDADVFQIVHPNDTPEKAAVDAWVRADIVIDLSSQPHAYGNIMKEARAAGTRLQRVASPEHVLRRLFPRQEARDRVQIGQKMMSAAETNYVTSPSGTDLMLYKRGRQSNGIYGVSDKPGRWDIWPAAMVHVAPEEDKGDGLLVLAPGDFMLVINQYVTENIYLEIKNGLITNIKGGMQAELLRNWFAQFGTQDAYRVAHVGWGCEKRANWLMPGQDNECYYGNMQIAFGSNVGIFDGARTLTKSHIDFVCLNNSYWIDDIQVMERGEFVIDDLKYKGEGGPWK